MVHDVPPPGTAVATVASSNGGQPATEPPGNPRVLWMALAAFSLGFGIWAVFAALGLDLRPAQDGGVWLEPRPRVH